MDDLKRFKVPALILSGGEPLLRPDIFDIAAAAKAHGLLHRAVQQRHADRRGDVPPDRRRRLRLRRRQPRRPGAPRTTSSAACRALSTSRCTAIRLCRDAGLKVGVRFTLTQDNFHDLPALLQLVEDEGIDRFYFSHLNYAGRGNKNRKDDAHHQMTRQAMDLLFDTCWRHQQQGLKKEFTTGNNDADGVYLLHWVRAQLSRPGSRTSGSQAARSGAAIPAASMSPISTTSAMCIRTPCGGITRWATCASGRSRRSGPDISDPLMAGLKARPRHVGGRCGQCRHFDICGGNTRVRAQQLTGDPWAEDPGCYLTDEEIGVVPCEA